MIENKKEEQNMSENKGNKLVVDDIEVVVRGVRSKPYYEIKYREVGNNDYNIGFCSYDLNDVLKWKEEEFEVVSEKEEKETKEVTNRMLLEHLKEIEIAQGCIANSINALFYVIGKRKEQLKLNRVEVEMIESGKIALCYTTGNMADISGMNEKAQKIEDEGFLDFLKENFE